MTEIKEEIKKIFKEIESIMVVTWQAANNRPSDWDEIKKGIIERQNRLYMNEEKELFCNLYELKEMLIGVIGGLPGLIDQKGKMDEESLTLLTNALTAFKKLKNEQEEDEEQIIPTEEEFYEFFKGEEIYQLEIELEEKEEEIADLREELASWEEAGKNKNKQLRQLKEKEQHARNEINLELSLIILSSAFPSELTTEQLTNFLTRLREMKSWLITGTDEQQKVIKEEYVQLKGILDLLKEEKELRNTRQSTRQNITDALADKGETILEKQVKVKVKAEWLLKEEHRSYSLILDEMDSSAEIIKFEREILQAIAEQRGEYRDINIALSWGKKAIEDKNVNQAEKVEQYLSRYRKLQLWQKDDIFRNKADEIQARRIELQLFISEQKKATAQIEQPAK